MGNDEDVVAADDLGLVRRLGVLVESVHAVVYFAPEPLAAYAELGLRGYWRGYFASRAAPLGAAGPQFVTALFGGFAPTMVSRAVPHVWSVASPPQVQAARSAGATAALRRLLGEHRLPAVAAAAMLTGGACGPCPFRAGRWRPRRPRCSAQTTRWPRYGTTAQCCASTVATGTWRPSPSPGWSGRSRTCCRGERVDAQQQQHRGWDDQTWRAAAERVHGRDMCEVEVMTDRLAAPAYRALDRAEGVELGQILEPLALAASSQLPYPNAMGLPRPVAGPDALI